MIDPSFSISIIAASWESNEARNPRNKGLSLSRSISALMGADVVTVRGRLKLLLDSFIPSTHRDTKRPTNRTAFHSD